MDKEIAFQCVTECICTALSLIRENQIESAIDALRIAKNEMNRVVWHGRLEFVDEKNRQLAEVKKNRAIFFVTLMHVIKSHPKEHQDELIEKFNESFDSIIESFKREKYSFRKI